MGNYFGKFHLCGLIKPEYPIHKISMFGLDNSGKTTILYKLAKQNDPNFDFITIPTIGFNVETVQHRNMCLSIWDVGGGSMIYKIWHHYCGDGIIFVIDCTDRNRLPEVKEKYEYLLAELKKFKVEDEDEFQVPAVLIMANKQDLSGGMTSKEIITSLDLENGTFGSRWHIQETCALNCEGFNEGLDWLVDQISQYKCRDRIRIDE